MTNEIIIVSTPYVPGYKITKTIGVTWGLIVRSRGLGRNITAGLRSIVGGEIHEYTELLNQSREQALDRLTGACAGHRGQCGREHAVRFLGDWRGYDRIARIRDRGRC